MVNDGISIKNDQYCNRNQSIEIEKNKGKLIRKNKKWDNTILNSSKISVDKKESRMGSSTFATFLG